MRSDLSIPLVLPTQFIQAVRDSGYKSIGSALAELIDNAFEADASEVRVRLASQNAPQSDVNVAIADNGKGMNAATLRHALQFGWSSRFNNRTTIGRYGMGLPNASLSHARRVEVLSCSDGKNAFAAHLDVDEVVRHGMVQIPATRAISRTYFQEHNPWKRGTTVFWAQCDRISPRITPHTLSKLRFELGRLFRYQIWSRKRITLNEEPVRSFDPLFERDGLNLRGARPFGPELVYDVAVPGDKLITSRIKVRFVELPIERWHSLSNSEKNNHGISKNAGVSIVRAGREIDRGWFFFGEKRRENYDDWWRCEVWFEPPLDELFGVTHTKQEIHPTSQLFSILVPDMERIARELNARARRAFVKVKAALASRESEKRAELHDRLLEPPPNAIPSENQHGPRFGRGGRGRIGGLEYRLQFRRLDNPCFYEFRLDGSRLTVVLNEAHPIVRLNFSSDIGKNFPRTQIELLILAAARAELNFANNKRATSWTRTFRRSWSRTLATFLS